MFTAALALALGSQPAPASNCYLPAVGSPTPTDGAAEVPTSIAVHYRVYKLGANQDGYQIRKLPDNGADPSTEVDAVETRIGTLGILEPVEPLQPHSTYELTGVASDRYYEAWVGTFTTAAGPDDEAPEPTEITDVVFHSDDYCGSGYGFGESVTVSLSPAIGDELVSYELEINGEVKRSLSATIGLSSCPCPTEDFPFENSGDILRARVIDLSGNASSWSDTYVVPGRRPVGAGNSEGRVGCDSGGGRFDLVGGILLCALLYGSGRSRGMRPQVKDD